MTAKPSKPIYYFIHYYILPRSPSDEPRSKSRLRIIKAWTAENGIANAKFTHFPIILEYEKKKSEMHTNLLSFMSDLETKI